MAGSAGLHQLIRLGDDALADFLGRCVTAALQLYLQARQSAQTFAPMNPFSAFNPFAGDDFLRSFTGAGQAPPAAAAPAGDVAELKRELDELKKSLRKRKK